MSNKKSNQSRKACLWIGASMALWYGALSARAEQPLSTVAAPAEAQPAPRHFDKVTTLDGKTYEDVTIQKIQPDGLLVEFHTAGGGFGTAKLKFRNLPGPVRERYGYEPRQAEAFEASQAEGEREWNAQNEAWTERREAALAEQMARAQRLREQANAKEASRQASEQARAEQPPPPAPGYGWPLGWGWTGGWNSHPHHAPRPVNPPAPTPPVSPFMGPMRPLGK